MAKPTAAHDIPRREIHDAKTMRAVAHPVRLALLDLLRSESELTATRAAELLGESPGNMSWHLQTLARYGFIEEVEGTKGRSRPWRMPMVTNKFHAEDDDPGAQAAGAALETLLLERSVEQRHQWQRARNDYPPEWRDAAFLTDSIAYLTPEELAELSEAVAKLYMGFLERIDKDLRPERALPVHLTAFAHPVPEAEAHRSSPDT